MIADKNADKNDCWRKICRMGEKKEVIVAK